MSTAAATDDWDALGDWENTPTDEVPDVDVNADAGSTSHVTADAHTVDGDTAAADAVGMDGATAQAAGSSPSIPTADGTWIVSITDTDGSRSWLGPTGLQASETTAYRYPTRLGALAAAKPHKTPTSVRVEAKSLVGVGGKAWTRAKEPRPVLTIRVAQSGVDRVDQLAASASVNRSEMTRRLLAYAVQHMPANWNDGGGRS